MTASRVAAASFLKATLDARPGRAASVRSLATPTILTATLVAYTALAIGYALSTPVWQNPDEPAHFNYIAQVAETGTLPVLQAGDWDAQLLERLKTGRLQPGDSIGSIRYEAWQPPLYYLMAAPVYRLGAGHELTQRVDELRLFDAVLGGLTLVVAYFAARELLPASHALAVPVVIAGIPMFSAIAAAVSDDALANLLAATLVFVLLRSLRQPNRLDARHAAGLGVLVGLGILTKLALVIFAPLALVIILYVSKRALREAAVMVATTAVVCVPWLIHQVTSYGWTDPLAITRHALVADQPRFPGLSPEYLSSFATITFHSFWAQFGWMAILAPDRLYWAWGLITIGAALGLVLRLGSPRIEARWLLMIGVVVGAWCAYVGYNLTFQQPQGRYLFTALVPLAALAVVGWTTWLPAQARPVAALTGSAVLVVLNVYALVRVLGPGFAS